MKRSTIFLIFMDLLCVFLLVLVYGPYSGFRNMFVTTAMTTKSHRYLARILYSEDTINTIMDQNKTVETGESTEETEIVFNNEEVEFYESIYEEQVLKRDPGNDLYKIIEFDGDGYHAYLTVIYDASRISTVKSKYYRNRGEYLSQMAADNNAIVAINGGGFSDLNGEGDGASASGIFISNGEIIENNDGKPANIIGMSKNNVLTLSYMTAYQAIQAGIEDAVCFGPFLIVNGKSATISGNGGYGVNPRTVIAQRKDGIVLFLVVDGTGNKYGFRGGANMAQLIEILERYGAYNAANLDGGASSVLAINGKAYNHPVAYSSAGERWLPNGWIVK